MRKPARLRNVIESAPSRRMRIPDWSSLPGAERLLLRAQYSDYLDSLPQCCALNARATRFGDWLRELGVAGMFPAGCRQCIYPETGVDC